MTTSHILPLPIASYANCHVVLAWFSRSADDYLRFLTPSLGAGGLFFELVARGIQGRFPRLTVMGARETVAFRVLNVMEG